MKVLFLCEGSTVPASRFRVGQFVPHWRANGVECTVRYAYDHRYNAARLSRWAKPYQLLWRLKRLPMAVDAARFDMVFLQRPALPFHPGPDLLAGRLNPRTVFDVDDSIWLGPGGTTSRGRRMTFERNVERCAHYIAGNQFLAREAGAPQKTTIIPTVIDTDRYTPASDSRRGNPIIGWMGTSGNFPFLTSIVPALRSVLEARSDATLRLVSNETFAPLDGHPQVEQIPWSAADEIDLLRSFDVGLMPLHDTPLTRGKCGFKMIQYMAVGCPVVASAVGANPEIFEGSDAGLLVEPHEWEEGILGLLDSAAARADAGARGRVRAEERYSVRAVLPTYLELFGRVASS